MASLTLLLLLAPAASLAASLPATQHYRCDGEPLAATLVRGPVDEPSLPDPSAGPVPVGGSVLLAWRDLQLQLPRTNNAGPAGFTDGRWWWSLEDPLHPRFRQRLSTGAIADFACSAEA
ncbi:MAG: hypothetical protein VKI83_11330 [Synechococcaceae cyanobacterium]|nr:hypothetical protein [Synechococcaceae cyanobacterium]